MTIKQDSVVSELLQAWSHGAKDALEALVPLIYPELRQIAGRQFARQRMSHTLQPSALVNELYLRFEERKEVDWRDREHFLAIAATEMRRILITHARRKGAAKRGDGVARVLLTDVTDPSAEPGERWVDLLAVDEALTQLQALDPEAAKLVELRFFGGLSVPEAARALDVTERTVYRHWSVARAWLYRQLTRSADVGDGKANVAPT